MSILQLPAFPLGILTALTVASFLLFVVDSVNAYRQRQIPMMAISIVLALLGFLLVNLFHEFGRHLFEETDLPSFIGTMGDWSWFIYLLFVVLLVGSSIAFLAYLYLRGKREITVSSIKEGVDELDSGVCFYREDGRLILSNRKMDAIANELWGSSIYLGTELYSKVDADGLAKLSQGVYSFQRHEFSFDGEKAYELIAHDVSELYETRLALEQENEKIRERIEVLREYNANIGDIIRKEEILSAKLKIHDEMNGLLLSSVSVGESKQERAKTLALWKRNVLLLCIGDSTEAKDNAISDLQVIAKLIGLRVKILGAGLLPKEDFPGFVSLAKEAMYNAKKHGEANEVEIRFSQLPGGTLLEIANDGSLPQGEFHESGGLKQIHERVLRRGGSMGIETQPRFTLKIVIPKGDKQ